MSFLKTWQMKTFNSAGVCVCVCVCVLCVYALSVCVCVFCVCMLSLSLCVCVLCVCVSVFINRVDSNAHNSSRDDASAAHNASHATLCVLEKNGRWRPQTIRENSARKSPCTTRSRRRRRRRLRRSWKTWASREQRGYVCQKRRLNARVAQLLCRM